MISSKEYLRAAVASRALFIEMFQSGLSVLPPMPEGEYSIEEVRSLTDLAEALGVSRSTVLQDMTRLENYRWITTKKVKGRTTRILGRRVDGHVYLIADLPAKAATGEDNLISREVLGLKAARPPEEKPKPPRRKGRGAMRKWRPS